MMDPKELETFKQMIYNQLYEGVPCNIAVIDRKMRIVDHNRNFAEVFGEGRGKLCYEVYKKKSTICSQCMTMKTFEDGKERVNDAEGVDRNGQPAHYVVHITPVKLPNGEIPYVIEMSTDITDTRRLQREYNILFERVPCYVAVLNRDLRIVRANEHLRKTFGKTTGERCYEVLKKCTEKCEDCPASQTFNDGKVHRSEHVGISQSGKRTHYIVTTSPLSKKGSEISHVIEVALDISEMRRLESELEEENELREILIKNSIDGVMGVDANRKISLFNPAAEMLSQYARSEVLGQTAPTPLFPDDFESVIKGEQDHCLLPSTKMTQKCGDDIPVRFTGVALRRHGEHVGAAAFVQDLREIRKLEKEKIDAERLAAVGQTVAGLAHGIKNILTGLEGGMYVFHGGMEKNNRKRMDRGWAMLERNIERISVLARSLLGFSKGEAPDVTIMDPVELAKEIVDLYSDAMEKEKINIRLEAPQPVAHMAMDKEDMHSCLANLVSNAIDACQMSDNAGCNVTVRCYEKDGTIVFEVEDEGCGMDYEIKKKAFTTFFTTKGKGGTGLGLLLTRKIVQEHGGKIDCESTPLEGTVFKLTFPRSRLPQAEGAETIDIDPQSDPKRRTK